MGLCQSKEYAAASDRSNVIDKQIQSEAEKFKRECKILLLGKFPQPFGMVHSLTLPSINVTHSIFYIPDDGINHFRLG
jgi:hypothetical protein